MTYVYSYSLAIRHHITTDRNIMSMLYKDRAPYTYEVIRYFATEAK